MHRFRHFVILALIFLGLWSCSKRTDDCTIVNIDINEAVPISGFEVFSHPDTILLSSESEFLPGELYKSRLISDTMYIIDPFKARGVFVFDSVGQLSGALTTIGNGPGEPLSYTSFDVDSLFIYILDAQSSHLHIYNKRMDWIKSIEIEPMSQMLATDKAGGIWFDKGNVSSYYGKDIDNMLYYRDCDGQTNGVLSAPRHLKNLNITPIDNFCKFGDSISYMPCLQPIIYNLRQDSVEPKFKLEFNGLWPTEDFLTLKEDEIIPDMLLRWQESNYVMNLCFLEDAEWLQLTFTQGDKIFLFLKNKVDGKTALLYDDFTRFGYPIALEDGKLYIADPQDGLIRIYNFNLLNL